MTVIERQISIHASRQAVWAALAELDAVAAWNPGVLRAHCEPSAAGVGAVRTCELRNGGVITETVTTWNPVREIWFAVGSHGAIRSADFGFELIDEEPSDLGSRTNVRVIADWHLHHGPLGAVIDELTVRRLMARSLEATLVGLKDHVERVATPTAER